MCLSNISKKKVATEDIVCWKALRLRSYEFHAKIYSIKSGLDFTGMINNIEVAGKIFIDKDTYQAIYFFTDEPRCNGSTPYTHPSKYNYKYSWALDSWVNYFIVDGIKYERVRNLVTPYYAHRIECGETYTSKIVLYGRWPNKTIEQALHSYKNVSSLEYRDIYAKCTIPKGSTYYIGEFDDEVSYASNKLRYDEIHDHDLIT